VLRSCVDNWKERATEEHPELGRLPNMKEKAQKYVATQR
jgi:hypothetical protein